MPPRFHLKKYMYSIHTSKTNPESRLDHNPLDRTDPYFLLNSSPQFCYDLIHENQAFLYAFMAF